MNERHTKKAMKLHSFLVQLGVHFTHHASSKILREQGEIKIVVLTHMKSAVAIWVAYVL